MKKINIFTTGGNRKFIKETFKKIIKKNNYNLKAALVDVFDDELENVFNCIQVSEKDLYNMEFYTKNSNFLNKFNLEINFIRNANLYFDLFFSSYDRVQPFPNSYNHIKNIYLFQLNYFNNILQKYKINKIFFLNTPHYPAQLSLYIVSKLLNIKIIIQQRSDINSLYFLRGDLIDFNYTYQVNLKSKNLLLKINDYFNNKHYQSIYITLGKNKNSIVNKYYHSLFGRIKLFFINVLKIFYIDICARFLSLNKKDINYSSVWGNQSKPFYMITLIKIKRILSLFKQYKFLKSVEISPDLECDYIFFALHFQPERSTLPEGDIFNDQLLAIRILSKSIPENYRIYIKEHPRQLDYYPQLSKTHFRSVDYYYQINKLPNVFFVPIFENIDNLISNAKFVSTITGSIGIDAIKKNIPAIIFSNTWYSKHELAHICNDSKDIAKIFLKKNKFSDNKIANFKFINEISQFLFLSSDGVLDIESNSIDKLSDSLSNQIVKIFSQ
jgi:hypothetical protein